MERGARRLLWGSSSGGGRHGGGRHGGGRHGGGRHGGGRLCRREHRGGSRGHHSAVHEGRGLRHRSGGVGAALDDEAAQDAAILWAHVLRRPQAPGQVSFCAKIAS